MRSPLSSLCRRPDCPVSPPEFAKFVFIGFPRKSFGFPSAFRDTSSSIGLTIECACVPLHGSVFPPPTFLCPLILFRLFSYRPSSCFYLRHLNTRFPPPCRNSPLIPCLARNILTLRFCVSQAPEPEILFHPYTIAVRGDADRLFAQVTVPLCIDPFKIFDNGACYRLRRLFCPPFTIASLPLFILIRLFF